MVGRWVDGHVVAFVGVVVVVVAAWLFCFYRSLILVIGCWFLVFGCQSLVFVFLVFGCLFGWLLVWLVWLVDWLGGW